MLTRFSETSAPLFVSTSSSSSTMVGVFDTGGVFAIAAFGIVDNDSLEVVPVCSIEFRNGLFDLMVDGRSAFSLICGISCSEMAETLETVHTLQSPWYVCPRILRRQSQPWTSTVLHKQLTQNVSELSAKLRTISTESMPTT